MAGDIPAIRPFFRLFIPAICQPSNMSNIGSRVSEDGTSNENISISSPNEVETAVEDEQSKKRKFMEPRAKRWQWFDKIIHGKTGAQKEKCINDADFSILWIT
ncbi:hypothetical protein P3S67_030486 [Capsicum chacoense]